MHSKPSPAWRSRRRPYWTIVAAVALLALIAQYRIITRMNPRKDPESLPADISQSPDVAKITSVAGLVPSQEPTRLIANAAARENSALVLHRYGPFLAQRGLTSAMIAEFIEFYLQRLELEMDVQEVAQMRRENSRVEAMRRKLVEPIRLEMVRLLGGEESYTSFAAFEKQSFYRMGFVDRLLPALTVHGDVSPSLADRLLEIVQNNDRRPWTGSTIVGGRFDVDWGAVEEQSRGHLNQAQQAALSIFIEQERNREPPR